jgi:hypothetical protein
MNATTEIEGFSIIVIGSFTPKIFHPAWLAKEGLIREVESENAEFSHFSSEGAFFSCGWFSAEITKERASFTTNQPQNYEMLRDLVSGIFNLLSYTPLTRLGLNWLIHFKMPTADAWHEVGHKFAPKKPWEGVIESPGMLDISMRGKRPDDHKGQINITIQPSLRVVEGVYLLVNDDYILEESKDHKVAVSQMIKILTEDYEKSFSRRNDFSKKLLTV